MPGGAAVAVPARPGEAGYGSGCDVLAKRTMRVLSFVRGPSCPASSLRRVSGMNQDAEDPEGLERGTTEIGRPQR